MPLIFKKQLKFHSQTLLHGVHPTPYLTATSSPCCFDKSHSEFVYIPAVSQKSLQPVVAGMMHFPLPKCSL